MYPFDCELSLQDIIHTLQRNISPKPVLKVAQFISSKVLLHLWLNEGRLTCAAAPCSQLFPLPSKHCCADSQIVTQSVPVFEEYFLPAKNKKQKTKLLQLQLLNQHISNKLPQGFFFIIIIANRLKAAIIIFVFFCPVVTETLRTLPQQR